VGLRVPVDPPLGWAAALRVRLDLEGVESPEALRLSGAVHLRGEGLVVRVTVAAQPPEELAGVIPGGVVGLAHDAAETAGWGPPAGLGRCGEGVDLRLAGGGRQERLDRETVVVLQVADQFDGRA